MKNVVRRVSICIALGLLGLLSVGARAADPITAKAQGRPRLQLSIDTPEQGAVVGSIGGMAFLSGKALAHFGEFQTFDIMFVVDTSSSTEAPSGADVDGDGEIGVRKEPPLLPIPLLASLLGSNSDTGDSVLAAEVAAMQTLLDQLDPRTTRVGLIGFSGDADALTPDAETYVELTSEFQKVRRGLDGILSSGPRGKTNMMAGVRVGTVELIGSQTAFSTKREGARRIMIFLTDGIPTLPFENSSHQNRRLAVEAAKVASNAQIRIDTYAIGPEALDRPDVVIDMAGVSSGIFTPVRDPRDLSTIFEDVSFSDIEEFRIKNKTTNAPADYLLRNADGTFSALIKMNEGMNEVEVYARSTDGTEGTRNLKVRFLESAEPQALDPALVTQRNRLMENALMDLKRERLEIETERDEKARKDLKLKIEEERASAQERARKVRIETEEDDDKVREE